MPNGWFKPVAKVAMAWGLPSSVTPRNTLIRPARLSARNRSPLGAVRMRRGLSSPDAYSATLNPAGASGQAAAGLSTSLGESATDGVAYDGGRSEVVILWTVPGS